MTIIEYKLDPQDQPDSYHPKTVPSYVSDGGYFFNQDDCKMIGLGVEGSIPDDVKTFTLEELQTRVLAIHAKYPREKFPLGGTLIVNYEAMTNDEVEAEVKEWVDAR